MSFLDKKETIKRYICLDCGKEFFEQHMQIYKQKNYCDHCVDSFACDWDTPVEWHTALRNLIRIEKDFFNYARRQKADEEIVSSVEANSTARIMFQLKKYMKIVEVIDDDDLLNELIKSSNEARDWMFEAVGLKRPEGAIRKFIKH